MPGLHTGCTGQGPKAARQPFINLKAKGGHSPTWKMILRAQKQAPRELPLLTLQKPVQILCITQGETVELSGFRESIVLQK